MRHGDEDKVLADMISLRDIAGRQGASILIEVIAEQVGRVVRGFKLPEAEAETVRDKLVAELYNAINERT